MRNSQSEFGDPSVQKSGTGAGTPIADLMLNDKQPKQEKLQTIKMIMRHL